MKTVGPLIHGELTESVIGSAMTVLNGLGCGLPEKIYERALIIELRKRGHIIDQQKEFVVTYDGAHVGSLIPDLVVDDRVIVDTKVVTGISDDEVAEMLSYLSVTALDLALLINFRSPRLEWKRVVRRTPSLEIRVNP